MQNSETPNDLVRQELSARLDTLVRDRTRLRNEREKAEKALREAADAEEANIERVSQFLAARISMMPKESFGNSLGYRVLTRQVLDYSEGTVLRVLFWNPGRPHMEWLVTDDPSIPTLDSEGPVYGADWDLIAAIKNLGHAFWVSAEETDEHTK